MPDQATIQSFIERWQASGAARPPSLPDEEILAKLVALNAERAAEEARGIVRWLRPEYQAGAAVEPVVKQGVLIEEEVGVGAGEQAKWPEEARSRGAGEKIDWPKGMAEQAQVVRQQLLAAREPVTARQVAANFAGARPARVEELLAMLVLLGQARSLEEGRFVGQ